MPRSFEEGDEEMNAKDGPTYVGETLRTVLTISGRNGWNCKFMDV